MSAQASTPSTLDSAIMAAWLAIYRKLIVDEGCVVRAGHGGTIEVQLVNRPGHQFQRINGPDGTQYFGAERDAIVRRLQGEAS